MSNTAFRNKLLTYLIISNQVPMQEMIAEFGARGYVSEAIQKRYL